MITVAPRISRALRSVLLNTYAPNESKPREPNVVYPSLVSRCPYEIAYKLKRGTPSDKARGYFAIGNILHESLQSAIRAQSEVSVRFSIDNIAIHGRIDVIINGYPYEIKTCTRLPEKPNYKHVHQLNIYTHILGKKYGYLVYVEKPTLRVKVFRVDHSSRMFQMDVNNFKLAISENPPKKSGWWCTYCPLNRECKGGVLNDNVRRERPEGSQSN